MIIIITIIIITIIIKERAVDKGNQSLIKEASTFAEKMGISLELSHPNPRCLKEDGTEVPNIKNHLKHSSRQQFEDKIRIPSQG